MIDLFLAAFSSPKEQAKLFMVLFSTLLAITILLLNQWFINRRGQKERMILKLEELTNAVHGVASVGHEINFARLNKLPDTENIIRLKGFCIEINKLCTLYFKKHPIDTGIEHEILIVRLNTNYLPTTHSSRIEIMNKDNFVIVRDILDKWFDETDAVISILTQKYIK